MNSIGRRGSCCVKREEGPEEAVSEPEETPVGPGLARMQGAMNYFRNYLEKGGGARVEGLTRAEYPSV